MLTIGGGRGDFDFIDRSIMLLFQCSHITYLNPCTYGIDLWLFSSTSESKARFRIVFMLMAKARSSLMLGLQGEIHPAGKQKAERIGPR